MSTEVVKAMIRALDAPALAELEHVLSLKLGHAQTPVDARISELGFLATLLRAHDGPVARVERRRYDELRPAEAPASKRLVERYGSWLHACRAASGLHEDGRALSAHNAWRNGNRGRRWQPYTLEQINDAIQACARETRRPRPSSNVYVLWSNKKRRALRQSGADVRVPTISTIYRRHANWESALNGALDGAK